MSGIIKLRGHHIPRLVEYIVLRDRGISHDAIMEIFLRNTPKHDRYGEDLQRFGKELSKRIYEDDGDLRIRIITFFDDVCTFPCKIFLDRENTAEVSNYFTLNFRLCIDQGSIENDLVQALSYGIKSHFLNSAQELLDRLRSSIRFKEEKEDRLYPNWWWGY